MGLLTHKVDIPASELTGSVGTGLNLAVGDRVMDIGLAVSADWDGGSEFNIGRSPMLVPSDIIINTGQLYNGDLPRVSPDTYGVTGLYLLAGANAGYSGQGLFGGEVTVEHELSIAPVDPPPTTGTLHVWVWVIPLNDTTTPPPSDGGQAVFTTAAQVLAYVGVKTPDELEAAWAEACAAAVNDGVTVRLNGAPTTLPLPSELTLAATMAGGEAYKRREAPFGITGFSDLQGEAIRIARDYLEGIKPTIDRYSNGPGIG